MSGQPRKLGMIGMEVRLPGPPPPFPRRLAARAALMALVWLGLNGTDWASWIVGAPVALAAAWLSARMLPASSWRWSARGALSFAGFFLRESLLGGWDVSRRALSPSLPLSPSILAYAPRLPVGAPRWLFCGTVNLLPGTAVVAIEDGRILVHGLSSESHANAELHELEARVAALFGLSLPEPVGDAP